MRDKSYPWVRTDVVGILDIMMKYLQAFKYLITNIFLL